MPITDTQKEAAQEVQRAAACDSSPQVRVVAGPGTGKSFVIEERVLWLLAQGVPPSAISVVSFTRASALDLRQRIVGRCERNGIPTGTQVRVSTLHSLALRTLRAAGLLTAYPADPLVLDDWEVTSIFDAEFGYSHGIAGKRCKEIRRQHEAYWSTGDWAPPNYIPPDPPISPAERQQFQEFHGPRTQAYACVLPGEIVRKCVGHMRAGTLDPVALLKLSHLIVDEYQDLNPIDLEFLGRVAAQGVTLFVAGDDDQSIYSFRFAMPSGIRDFPRKYPLCGLHTLTHCFRCTPTVLAAGETIIKANPGPNRIPKSYVSLYESSSPPLEGLVHRWRFASGTHEARAVAESCAELIRAGIKPRDILVLLSNQDVLGKPVAAALRAAGVPFEPPRGETFRDTQAGRAVLALLRIVCDRDDYVAHRTILGFLPGVGVATCHAICQAVIDNNLNYRDVFYRPVPEEVFSGRATQALDRARAICQRLSAWQDTDPLAERLADISGILGNLLTVKDREAWEAYAATLPGAITLEELRDLLWADTDEQQARLLQSVYERLDEPVPTEGLLPNKVRVMTMHGAKGLSGRVVFIPGLEEEILPGPWRQPYPGLVLEAARLLYVSITRAQAACIVSFAGGRKVYGEFRRHAPSRFCTQLGGPFSFRTSGLTPSEVREVVDTCSAL